ncbi:MAG TPA: hypothetical protein VFW50_37915 [Streptosporangiaceae bacterium]|nr:hypothetical protein [Streptosporangiaceae bacterium]
MGSIRVHEFISLDGVIDAPSWTFPFGFDPRMGEALGRVTGGGGPRLFDESLAPATWQRAGVEVYDNGVTYLHLTPAPA